MDLVGVEGLVQLGGGGGRGVDLAVAGIGLLLLLLLRREVRGVNALHQILRLVLDGVLDDLLHHLLLLALLLVLVMFATVASLSAFELFVSLAVGEFLIAPVFFVF